MVMNKFNKRRTSAVKCKRQKQRVVKKRLGVVEKHKTQMVAVSGKRTGKAAKKRERRERLKVRRKPRKLALSGNKSPLFPGFCP